MFNQFRLQLRGRSHDKTATPCQDATYYDSNGEVQAIALSDGAGSARFSGYGAQTTTRKACRYLADNFLEMYNCEDGVTVKTGLLSCLLSALEMQRDRIRQKPGNIDCEIRDLACTLLLVGVCNNQFILAHIGDGVIGYVDDGQIKVASAPDNGEFANATTFITSVNALSSMRLIKGKLDKISGFILMSDGTENSLYDRKLGELSQANTKLIEAVAKAPQVGKKGKRGKKPKYQREIEELFLKRIREGTGDDCSVAILGRHL